MSTCFFFLFFFIPRRKEEHRCKLFKLLSRNLQANVEKKTFYEKYLNSFFFSSFRHWKKHCSMHLLLWLEFSICTLHSVKCLYSVDFRIYFPFKEVCNWRQRHSDLPKQSEVLQNFIFFFYIKMKKITFHFHKEFQYTSLLPVMLVNCDFFDSYAMTMNYPSLIFIHFKLFTHVYFLSTFMKLKYAWHFHLSTHSLYIQFIFTKKIAQIFDSW